MSDTATQPATATNSQRTPYERRHEILADFMSCLIPAFIAGLPYALDALMKCLSGSNGGGSSDYAPGDRRRCG